MFSKITNLFQTKTSQLSNPNKQSFKHPKLDNSDPSQCPFMKKNTKNENKNEPKSQNNPQKLKNQQLDSDQEQQRPKGGCPFMGTSEKKKNPSLSLSSYGYDEPFVSKFKYYLSANKMDFSGFNNKNKSLPAQRQIFQKYPIYLQNTLFYNSEDYKKVRGLQCCSRFMAYEQLRQKGNKYYNKGKYYMALDYYERAMSLFRWLQYYENNNETVLSENFSSNSMQNMDESSQNDSKINIEVNEQNEEDSNPFNELKQKYKEFFITYNDDNTKYFDGQQLVDVPDIDMRKSLLVQIYLNMAAAYINLQHYSLAEQVINDGLTLSENVSQLYFRKSQSIAFNMGSSIQKLKYGKGLIQKAIQMRPKEKIFNSANSNILKMLNLHDSQQSYQGCYEYIKQSLQMKQKKANELYQRIYNRSKQINQIQKRMIQEGKTPKQNLQQKVLHDTLEIKCLQRMANKYHKVIQFYTEAKNEEQVLLAKRQFQEVLRIQKEVNLVFGVNIVQKQNELGGIQTQKITKRINIIKSRIAEDIYNSGKYNFTMLEWAIKEIVNQDKQQENLNKSVQQIQKNKVEPKKINNIYLSIIIIPLLLILLNSFIL